VAKYALLVGIDAYPTALPLAACTPVSALDALRAELVRPDAGGFAEAQTLANPDRHRLTETLFDFYTAEHRGDTLLLYIAAAGVLDAAGRTFVLLPGWAGGRDPHLAMSVAAVMNSSRLSDCSRRIVLLDMGVVAAQSTPARRVLAAEALKLPDTAVLASAAGAPFVAVDGAMPRRRLLGPWLSGVLAAEGRGARHVLTVNGLYDRLRRETPPDERCDAPRLWLGHLSRGLVAIAREQTELPPAEPDLAAVRPRDTAPSGGRAATRAATRSYRVLVPAHGSPPQRATARPAQQPERRGNEGRSRRRRSGRLRRGTRFLWLSGRVAGLLMLGPTALYLSGEGTSRDLQVASAKLLHEVAPQAFRRLFVEGGGATFSDVLASGGRGPELAPLPGGFFTLGSYGGEPERHAAEGPAHRVGVDPFALAIAEVTFAEYDHFANRTGRQPPPDEGWGRGNRPVINVSWPDAVAYAEWLSAETGKQYFLPTEAQWEYAARAATDTPFASGGCLHTDQANYNGVFDYAACGARTGIFRGQTLPATALPPNRWGLYHMHGNVWEWVSDCWAPAYAVKPGIPPTAEEPARAPTRTCGRRVMRGGGWRFEPGYLRSAARLWSEPDTRNADIGFRVARVLD
jgi:formylglycine-generating enzyme required for sulfatase activity